MGSRVRVPPGSPKILRHTMDLRGGAVGRATRGRFRARPMPRWRGSRAGPVGWWPSTPASARAATAGRRRPLVLAPTEHSRNESSRCRDRVSRRRNRGSREDCACRYRRPACPPLNRQPNKSRNCTPTHRRALSTPSMWWQRARRSIGRRLSRVRSQGVDRSEFRPRNRAETSVLAYDLMLQLTLGGINHGGGCHIGCHNRARAR
jgi:hypothetical protein